MRVRTFELRLLAGGLTVLWAVAAGLVLVGYRPGGPVDQVVGMTSLAPIAIAAAALVWPPTTRGDRAFAAVAWLGLAAGLLLVPSIAGVFGQLVASGPQTLLPSPEAAYPWILALAATSLFAGLGLAREILGVAAMRRRRLVLGVAIAAGATLLSGAIFATAAISNELGLRDQPSRTSRFGPTAATTKLPSCTASIATGPTATLALTLAADVDGRSIGSVDIAGRRDGADVAWTAQVATDALIGQFELVHKGDSTWSKSPGDRWVVDPRPDEAMETLDREVADTLLAEPNRTAAEDRGLEFVEGARSRHCRIAVDGRTFQSAFPQIRWLADPVDLHRWRGEPRLLGLR